jgi:hypothetical protein
MLSTEIFLGGTATTVGTTQAGSGGSMVKMVCRSKCKIQEGQDLRRV